MNTVSGALPSLSQHRLRTPSASDSAAIRTIDIEGLASGHASFRVDPHDWRSFSTTFQPPSGLARVVEDANGVLGWAGIAGTSKRAVYAGVGEVSVYIAETARGRGVGHTLLSGLVQASENAGFWTLIAQIFPENEASIHLHRSCGFRIVGTRERLGQMTYGSLAGQWRDVVMLERRSERVGIVFP